MKSLFFSRLASKFFKKRNRNFARIRVHCLLKYKSIDGQSKLSFARDISAGGVLFHAKENIPVNNIVEIEINFPPRVDSIKVVAKVLRSRALKKMGGYDLATEFVNIDEKAKEFINNSIVNSYKARGKNIREGERH
ncbi:MAG: PilZ domain-containing protein [Candidatus Omnitrophica bacterium]|nr:PilZ domain-containing protein [Candidatus Omnitrophota bacterium]